MENIIICSGCKEEKYRTLIPQVRAMLEGETDPVARMSNTAAAIQETFGFLWTGFYRVVRKPDINDSTGKTSERMGSLPEQTDCDSPEESYELAVGPFQGPVACSRIAFGKGVCGSAWKEARTLVVPDVEQFPGHIRCSSAARSEIVVPVFRRRDANGLSWQEVMAVLDIDSASPGTFDGTDAMYLEEICRIV